MAEEKQNEEGNFFLDGPGVAVPSSEGGRGASQYRIFSASGFPVI